MAIDSQDTGDLQMDVARRMRQTRRALGLTQAEIAEQCQIGRTAYNQYETGTRMLTLTAALHLCEVYGLTLDWFYRGDPSGLPHRVFERIRADRSANK